MGFLNLGLLAQLTYEKRFFPDLYVITKEERNREDKKGEEIDANFETFLFNPQASNPEGGMAQNEDIVIFLIHRLSRDIFQNAIMNPARFSKEGDILISGSMCVFFAPKEKRNSTNISLKISSLFD